MIQSKQGLTFTKNYVFGTDGNLYRLPFVTKIGRKKSVHKCAFIQNQYYFINNERWTLTELRPLIYDLPKEEVITLFLTKYLPC